MESAAKTSVSPPRWTGLHSEYSPPKAGPDDGEPRPRSETRRPHLVNYGASRLSTSVTFIPLPEHGRLVIGLPDRAAPPDVSIQGMGVEPGHAVLESSAGRVTLLPQADMITVDGIRCTEAAQLTSGCMLCFGRSHYFKYMCPADYQPAPAAAAAVKADYLAMGRPPALDNPEYYHMCAEERQPEQLSPPLRVPPPKPPRQPAAETAFSGEYLYTRLERPPVPAPAARAPRPSPYDNVPLTSAAARAAAAAAAQGSEIDSAGRCKQMVERRDPSDGLHHLEQSRLDEILTMCAEYDSQMSGIPSPAGRPPDSPAPAHRRIKTNGSLPRDRRLGSPGPSEPPGRRSVSDDELGPPPPPAGDPRSPYENVPLAALPQSPRTRIRTTVSRQEGREPSPPAGTGTGTGAVYMVPPPPVPLPPPRLRPGETERRSLQFENKEYMRGVPADQDLHQDDMIFLPAPGCGYVNTAMDEETCRAAAETQRLSSRETPEQRLSSRETPEQRLSSRETPEQRLFSQETPEQRLSWRDELDRDSDEPGRHSRSCSDVTDDDRELCRRLKDQRRMTYRQLSELRQQKLDLEHQESEAIRQLEVEHALLEGEVETHCQRLEELENEAAQLRDTLSNRTDGREQTRRRQQHEAEQLASRIAAAETELERLELLSEKFRGTTDEETELLEKLKYQHELVEQERKVHEDQEFHHMEEQVAWEAEKEESLRVINELETRIANTRAEMESVREQQRSLIESIRSDTETMEKQRRMIVRQMCQERDKLKKTERRLSSLSQSGLEEAADEPDPEEPEPSSDAEEFSSNEYIESRLAQLHMLGKSRDDLQRIQNVTASSPMQVDNRSSTTLREIERNRHLLLAKQGTQVIEDERRRVEELKRRVQDEVTAQWQEQRRLHRPESASDTDTATPTPASPRVTNGHGSHMDSPPLAGHSPPIRHDGRQPRPISEDLRQPRPISEDLRQPQPISDDERPARPVSEDGRPCPPMSDDDDEDDPRPRPISDASSVFDGVEEPVRRRGKLPLSPQQRPLTRYLPITNQQFDLRQHIESAGHQLEVCPQVIVSRHACRGYLHKLSSRFKSWQKRWFVFDRSKNKRTFMYFSDKSETKAKGGVYFQAIEEVYVDHLKAGRRGSAPYTTFCVKTMSRTFYLMAPTPETMRIWVDVIMTGAEGNAAFGQG